MTQHVTEESFGELIERVVEILQASGATKAKFAIVVTEPSTEHEGSLWLRVGSNCGEEAGLMMLRQALYAELRAQMRRDLRSTVAETPRGPNLTCHKCRKQYPAGWRKDCTQCGAGHEEIYL